MRKNKIELDHKTILIPVFLKDIKELRTIDAYLYSLLFTLKKHKPYAYPSHNFLAKELFCGITTIKISLKKLEDLTLIRIEKNENENERTNRYYIIEHEFMKKQSLKPKKQKYIL